MAALLAPTDLLLTMGLGNELFILDTAALNTLITLQDALTNLRGFIAMAGRVSEDVSAETLKSWAAIISAIMQGPLSRSFELIAPREPLKEGKLATAILKEAAAEPA